MSLRHLPTLYTHHEGPPSAGVEQTRAKTSLHGDRYSLDKVAETRSKPAVANPGRRECLESEVCLFDMVREHSDNSSIPRHYQLSDGM